MRTWNDENMSNERPCGSVQSLYGLYIHSRFSNAYNTYPSNSVIKNYVCKAEALLHITLYTCVQNIYLIGVK